MAEEDPKKLELVAESVWLRLAARAGAVIIAIVVSILTWNFNRVIANVDVNTRAIINLDKNQFNILDRLQRVERKTGLSENSSPDRGLPGGILPQLPSRADAGPKVVY